MVQKRDTINPYYLGFNLIYHRMLWDMHPYSWISRKRIKTYKNKFCGQKAVILCNGPSLKKVDFDVFTRQNVATFGLNKINLLFLHTKFRPSFIVAVNPFVIEQNADFYNHTVIPLFLDSQGKRLIKFRKNIHFLHSKEIRSHFARDCSIGINQGFTVTYVAMQLAFHMGFKIVALVGCDHHFVHQGRANETLLSSNSDPDHFDPNYFVGGQKWQFPDIPGSELHYQIANEVFRQYGRQIVNCTDGGKLEIIERQSLFDFFNL